MKSKSFTKWFSASIALFGIMTAANADLNGNGGFPYDWKSIPGAGCQAYFGAQEQYIDKRADGAYNNSTVNRWVSCLNLRDNVRNLNGTAGEWLYIVQGAGQTTTCYHRSAGINGSNYETSSNSRSGSGWLYVDTTKSVVYGPYVKYCYLPPKARISTVLLKEFNDTDNNN